MAFSNMSHYDTEPIKDHVQQLKSSAIDYKFSYSNYQNDLTSEHVKDQFIEAYPLPNYKLEYLQRPAIQNH